MPDWLAAHAGALAMFGGVPALFVPDNAKVAVIKACLYDPQVNRSDAEMAARFVRAGWSNIDGGPRASLQKVAYRVEGGVLQRIAYPMIDGAAPFPATALLTGVERVPARYRFQGAWSDRWDGSQGAPLPQAVELSIARKGGQGYRAMVLIGTGYAPPSVTEVANAGP